MVQPIEAEADTNSNLMAVAFPHYRAAIRTEHEGVRDYCVECEADAPEAGDVGAADRSPEPEPDAAPDARVPPAVRKWARSVDAYRVDTPDSVGSSIGASVYVDGVVTPEALDRAPGRAGLSSSTPYRGARIDLFDVPEVQD